MNFILFMLGLLLALDYILLLHAHIPTIYTGTKEYYASKCGHHWLLEYSRLHASMESESGRISPRYLYFVPPPTGLADKVFAFITSFYLAVLSHRALKIADLEWGRIMMDSFENSQINLTSTFQRDEYFRCWDDGILTPKLNATVSWIFGNASEVAYMSNRGNTIALFDSEKYSAKLLSFGVEKRYAVYCGFYYLLKPKQIVIDEANELLSQRAKFNHTIIIGIHIRTGDETISKTKLVEDISHFMPAFDCAAKFEKQWMLSPVKNHEEPQIRWLVFSDSLEVRKEAKAKYGSKVVTDTTSVALHSSYGGHAIHRVTAEVLALSTSDYFIIDGTSGVGKLAAWLSRSRSSNDKNGANDSVDNVVEWRKCEVWSDDMQATSNQGI